MEKEEERHGPLYDGLREFALKYNLDVPKAPYKPGEPLHTHGRVSSPCPQMLLSNIE